jgi:hypothetical protein
MMKQIEIHGRRVKLYSPDGGRNWSSNPQSIVAYGQRKELLRLELQNSFARIDEMRDLDPDNFSGLDTPNTGRCVGRAGRVDRNEDQARPANHGGLRREGHPRGHCPRPDHLAR